MHNNSMNSSATRLKEFMNKKRGSEQSDRKRGYDGQQSTSQTGKSNQARSVGAPLNARNYKARRAYAMPAMDSQGVGGTDSDYDRYDSPMNKSSN